MNINYDTEGILLYRQDNNCLIIVLAVNRTHSLIHSQLIQTLIYDNEGQVSPFDNHNFL